MLKISYINIKTSNKIKEKSMIERILYLILSIANPSLKDYYKHCSEIGQYVGRHYNFKPNFYNERSIASFMTNYFYLGLIDSKEFNSVKYINEFAIKQNTSISKEKFDELKSKHGLNHLKTPNHFLEFFYPDTIFQIQQSQKVLNIFFEYKVSSKFILAELSYDFLKYLLYTDKSTSSSVFVYVLLSKNSNDDVYLLSDAKGFPTTYKIISDDFTEELKVLGSSKSIFIYEKRDNISFAEQSYMELDVLREISNVISVIKEEDISTESVVCAQNFLENPFVSQIDKFGENVITSSLLKENYLKF